MVGLRERKKQQTRDALIRTAHEMFVSRGYEQTRVEEIANAVDVSERTFFRYFAVKEDVVFALQEMVQERYYQAFLARPAAEPPLVALRCALDDGWRVIGESIAEVTPVELHLQMWQLIETTPALIAVQLRRGIQMEEQLASAVAERTQVDTAVDPRPRVLAAAFCGVLRAAMQKWGQSGDTTIDGAQRQVGEYLDQLQHSFASGWADGSEKQSATGRRQTDQQTGTAATA